jgi:Leucine-rich repeat (LRR) protein
MGNASLKDSKPNDGSIKQKLRMAQSTKLLSVCNAKLKELPRKVLGVELRSLDCSRNQLEGLPDDWRALTTLSKLFISENCIGIVNVSINRLTQLEELILDHNRLASLPEGLSLPSLRLLDVSYNQLETLPDTLGSLPYLTEIAASYNAFKELPRVVSASSSLESADFSHNSIAVLLDDWRPTRLTLLNLDYNPVDYLPSSLLKHSAVSRVIAEHTGITTEALREVEGLDDYESRHKARVDRAVDMNVEAKIGLFR